MPVRVQDAPIVGEVAQRLADSLLRGISPLQRISHRMQMMPVAAASGKAFHGINRWTLIMERRLDPRWFTVEQAEHIGARLRDGESGVKLVYWSREPSQTLPETVTLRVFTVFNAEQFDGMTPLPKETPRAVNFEAVRSILRNCGCQFEATERAVSYYDSGTDVIHAPHVREGVEREDRLADVIGAVVQRQLVNEDPQRDVPKGTRDYAETSLTQAMATFLTTLELGLPYEDAQDRAYYRDWAKLITDNPTALLRIAAHAESASRQVLAYGAETLQAVEAVTMPEDWNGRFQISDMVEGGVALDALRYGGGSVRIGTFDDRAQAESMRWQLSVLYGSNLPTRRDYLVVPWDERNTVRALGAKFDPAAKSWYVPEGLAAEAREKLDQWRPKAWSERQKMMARETQIKARESRAGERIFLEVPFPQKERVKAAGALFEPTKKRWYVSRLGPLEGVRQWLPEKYKELAAPYVPEGALKEAKRLYVPYESIYLAKSRGAIWNAKEKFWYAPIGSFEKDFKDWIQAPEQRDPRQEFLAVLIKNGFDPTRNAPVQMDGEKHRFTLKDDKTGHQSGEYRAYLDLKPAGMVRNFKTGAYETWSSRAPVAEVTAEQLEGMRRAAERARQEREAKLCAEQEKVAQRASDLYASFAKPGRDKLTDYEVRKGLDIAGRRPMCAAVDGRGHLVLPVQDIHGKVWSLQFISGDGTKKFMKGGRKRGCFAVVWGENTREHQIAQTETVVVAEGYATAMSISQALGEPVIVAFDAGNLMSVCQAVHQALPQHRILIAGDDDHAREVESGINPGRDKAMAVCRDAELGDFVETVFPVFPSSVQKEAKFTDFNDLANVTNLSEVQVQIEAGLMRARALAEETAPLEPLVHAMRMR